MKLLDGLPQGPETTSRRDTLRDLAIACMALPDLKPAGRVIDRPTGVFMSAFDPRMKRYAHIFRDSRVTVRRCSDDLEIAAFKAPAINEFWLFSFSPDGRYLVASQTPAVGLTVWDVDERRTALSVPGRVGNGVRFSPDSRRIVVRGNGEVLDYSLPGGELVRRLPVRMGTLAFRPDGAQVALIDNGSKPLVCRIFDWDTGLSVRAFELPDGSDELAWSPDGATLAVCADTKIHLWDPTTSIRRGLLEGQNTSGGLTAAFHPAGTLLASNGFEQMLRISDPILGRPVLDMAGDGRAQVSEDGQIVILQGDKLRTYQIVPALEYRTFAFASREPAQYERPSVRRDGRLLAVGTDQGVALWDLVHGTELAFLQIGYAKHTMVDPSGDLIVSGPLGVRRWPIAFDAARGVLDIGPSRLLTLPAGYCEIATDDSGQIVAVAHHNYAYVATPLGTKRFGPLNDCRTVAVSPDGKWLATGTHTTSQGAQVWRIADLAKDAEFPIDRGTVVVFSPDGKWLMTTSAPCQLWEVGSWRKANQVGDGRGCFSPDGRLMAVQGTSRLIRLVETETGRTLARLESPGLWRGWPLFSPDGSRLVVSAYDGAAVHVWDLRTIRRQLAAMGLDWDAPPYSDQDPAAMSVPPIKHLDIRDFFLNTTRGAALAVEGRWEEAVVAYDQAFTYGEREGPDRSLERAILKLAVGDGAGYRSTCRQMLDVYHGNNDFAWYVYAAHAIVLDTDGPAERLQALRMAERRARESPDVYSEHVMGLALYRNGRFAEAEAREMANIARNRGWRCEVLDRLVVAMAQQGLGRHEDATRSLEQAEKWIAEQRRDRPGGPDRAVPEGWLWRDAVMMQILLREARGVIRAESPRLPRDVFAPAP